MGAPATGALGAVTIPDPPSPAASAPPPATGADAISADTVRDLQRELRRRGEPVDVDGRLGAATRAAIARRQLRLGLRPTGRPDPALLAALGLRVRGVASGPPAVPLTRLAWPGGRVVASPFGPRGGRMHEGVDLLAPAGDPVSAAADGVVTFAGAESGYGNLVIVNHGAGLETAYAHLSRMLVGVGAQVARGQRMGDVGSTGNATTPHLHFEVRVNRTPVDPEPYLPRRR